MTQSAGETLRKMIKDAMRSGEAVLRDDLKYLLGEVQRKTDGGDMDMDGFLGKVVKPCRKSETQRMEAAGETAPTPFLSLLDSFLPKQATEEEIREFVRTLPDREPRRMGEIMKRFSGAVDGGLARKVLAETP